MSFLTMNSLWWNSFSRMIFFSVYKSFCLISSHSSFQWRLSSHVFSLAIFDIQEQRNMLRATPTTRYLNDLHISTTLILSLNTIRNFTVFKTCLKKGDRLVNLQVYQKAIEDHSKKFLWLNQKKEPLTNLRTLMLLIYWLAIETKN